MPPRDTDTTSVTYNNQDAQAHAEILACLVLRSGSEDTVITPAEKLALYEAYPGGFGLLAIEDGRGGIRLSVVSGQGRADAATLAAALGEQGGRVKEDQIPPSLRQKRRRRES